MKYIIYVLACVTILGAHAFEQAFGQTKINPGEQVNWPSSCTTGTVYSPFSNGCISGSEGQTPNPTIQSAVTAAGTTGSVLIPPGYAGTDTFTNPHNIVIDDQRPHNPTNSSTYVSGPMPQTTIKASDYGAVCDGVNDDTAAINHAVQALTTLIGGAGGSTTWMGNGAVELPQGRCEISSSIVLTDYGSLIGSPGGTWIFPLEPWLGADPALVIVTTSYSPTGFLGTSHGRGFNRQVTGIAFEYNFNATAHTAIKVVSGYGHTSTTAYPASQNDPQAYQLNNVTIANNYIFAMDTAIDLQDCGQCEILNNYISFTRQGVFDDGNSFAVVLRDNSLSNGSSLFTPTSGTVSGIISQSQPRYLCTSGSGPSCTTTQIISSPQALSIFGQTTEHWGIAGNFINILGLNIADGSCFCDSGISVYLGQLVGVSITGSTFSTETAGPVIEIAAPTHTPGVGLAFDNGWWISGNAINTDNNTQGTAVGVQLDSGSLGFVNLDLTHNQFFGFATAIQLNGPLVNSRITDNYGDDNATSLITLNAAGSGSFASTVIANNTSRDSVPILVDTAGGGYQLGYNQSVSQVLGTFIATGAGCTMSAGAIGTFCGVTMTNPVPFLDDNYIVTGCAVVGASDKNTVSQIGPMTNGGVFPVGEVTLTTTARGGGTIYCSVTHQ